MNNSQKYEIEKGKSSDGYIVYKLDSDVYLIDTTDPSKTIIYHRGYNTKPLYELNKIDFYGRHYEHDNEQDFLKYLEKCSHHYKQRDSLNRRRIYNYPRSSPWGAIQNAIAYTENEQDIISVDTASHGGFKVSASFNKQIPAAVRKKSGWYEEDCEWAIVVTCFPECFTDYDKECAERSLRNNYPDFWEKWYGKELKPGESSSRDEAAFKKQHAHDYVVLSAISSSYVENMVEVIATLGGIREHDTPEKRFLVSSNEYRGRSEFGFVIDPNKHSEYGGISDFVRYKHMNEGKE